MSLSALTYKYIGKFTAPASNTSGTMAALATAFSSTTYADGSSRVTGSGIAWTPYSQISTGTTIAVSLTPVTSTLGHKIVYAGGSAGSPTMLSPDTYSVLRVNFGMCKNAGNFNSWSDANPFGTGQFSGYTGCWVGTSISYIHAYESQDTVFVIAESNTGNCFLSTAGANIDPESTTSGTSESDGKIYSLITTGYSGVSSISHEAIGLQGFLWHGTGQGDSHVYVMNFGGSGTTTSRKFNGTPNVAATANSLKNAVGEYARLPIYVENISATRTFFGRLREIFMFPNGSSATKFTVSGTTNGYIISASTAAVGQAILLKA